MRATVLVSMLLLTGVAVPGDAATTSYGRPCTAAELDAMTAGAPDAPPPGISTCVGVLPGMRVFTTTRAGQASSCAVGMLYRGADGRTYTTAPGRCLLKPQEECVHEQIDLPLAFPVPVDIPLCVILDPGYADEEPVFPRGKGVPVRDAQGRRIGEWAYAVYQADMDFGLIRLDANIAFSPKVCHWGGPTGMETEVRTVPEQVLLAQGTSGNWGLAARGLYSLDRFDFTYDVLGPGGLVLTMDGKAVGSFDDVSYVGSGRRVVRYPLGLDRVRTKLRLGLTLLTAPLNP